jgi:hypothetical protein
MKKIIFISALLLGLLGSVCAQDETTDFAPAAGDFSGAVLFGRGSYQFSGLDVPSAPGVYYSYAPWTVSGSAPYLNSVEAGSNSVTNMLGVEGRYFVTPKIAIKVSGGVIIRSTPPHDNAPGVIDPSSPNGTWIPNYEAVVQTQNVDLNFNLGGDFIFPSKKFERMFPYVGVNVPFLYGRRTEYDPTIIDLDPEDPNSEIVITDIGLRHAEIFGFGLQAVAGVDYYIAKGLYFGFEFKPVSYVYAFNRKIPAPGLEPWEADTHTFSFFQQIYLKLGFRF